MNPFKGGNTITQLFGERPEYYKQFGLAGHEGLDIVPSDNDRTIYAVEDGEVVRDIDDPRSGAYGIYCVILNRQTGRAWWYCHESVNNVNIGDIFKQGQAIAVMGGTGNTQGDHLHLGLRLADSNGNAINTDNGYKGFIDPKPVLDQLNLQPPLQPNPDALQQQLDAKNKAYDDLYVQDQDNLHTISQQKDVIDNLNQQINDRNNDITQLNAEVQKKETELQARDQELSIVKPLAAQLPNLKEQLAQSEQNRQLCLGAQSNQNIKISNLEAQIAAGKPKGFVNKLIYVFS